MKKLVLILLITLSTTTFAQNDKEHYVAFSAAVDIKNLLLRVQRFCCIIIA